MFVGTSGERDTMYDNIEIVYKEKYSHIYFWKGAQIKMWIYCKILIVSYYTHTRA